MCHLWPSISPWNVWDLEWGHWVAFAAAADEWSEQMRKEAPE